jgi:serine/threonine-protein kinase
MRDDILRAVRVAVGGAFEILGEMGREGDHAVAYLARENNTGRLVALKLEKEEVDRADSDLSLTVRRELDSSVPAKHEQCPLCATTVEGWNRYCPNCSQDLSGTGVSGDTNIAELRRFAGTAAAGRYELLGEMPRSEGGRPVFFARETDTGEIVALRLDRMSDPGGDRFAVSVTQTFRSIRASPASAGATGVPLPRVTYHGTGQRAASPAPPKGPPAAAAGPASPAASTGQAYLCPACGAEYEVGTWFCPRDGSALKPRVTGPDLVGRIIAGRYKVIRKVGEGGMGHVYYAEHVRIGKPFALKIMNPSLKADPEAMGRFGREAGHASRIDHPHVATVHDFGETDDGLIYLAMEFAEGDRLTDIIEHDGALEPMRAAEIARQVADALVTAHELSIVHRDLKPDNILIARRNNRDFAKVVDFGIAKTIQTGESQKLTRTGYIVGTPRYMSPEQLINESIDGRTDIYSLGCILYEMLVGQPAFSGPTGESVITRRLTQPPPSARESRPEVPESLDRVVLKALARSPADRFAGAAELRDALAEVIAHAATERPAPAAKGRAAAARSATAGKPEPIAPPASTPAPPAEKSKAAKTRPAPPPPPVEPVRAAAPATARPAGADRSGLARVPRSVWFALAGTATLAVIAFALMSGGPEESTTTQTATTSDPPQPERTAPTQARTDSPAPLATSPPPAESTRVAGGGPGRSPDSARQRAQQQTVQQTTPQRGRESPPARQTPPPVVTPPRAQRDSPVTTAVQRDSTTAARTTQQTPPPPTVPSTAAVDSVRAFFAQASRLEENGDYAGAFRSLGDAAARIVQLRAAFPTAAVMTTLDQEHRDRRASTVRACQAFREVRISLGLTPPDCPAS